MFYLSVLCGCEEFSEGTFLSICVIKNHLCVIEPVTAGIVRSDIEREENGGIIWPWERGCSTVTAVGRLGQWLCFSMTAWKVPD